MPVGPGRYITFDDVLRFRWKVEMKARPVPPRVCSKAWKNGGLSQRQALIYVPRWAWDVEKELPGAECPYDLSS